MDQSIEDNKESLAVKITTMDDCDKHDLPELKEEEQKLSRKDNKLNWKR